MSGGINFDLHTINGQYLQPTIWKIFLHFFKHPNTLITVERFMDLLYETRIDPPYEKIIQVYICRLRKKLKDTPYKITTRWGAGFIFSVTFHHTGQKQEHEKALYESQRSVQQP